MKVSSSIVRYVFPGILLFVLVLLTYSEARLLLSEYKNNKTALSIIFVALGVTGVVTHHIYHLFYSFAFTRFQDKYRIKTDSYRTYLSKRYGITQDQSMSLFRFLRDKYFNDIYNEKMEITGATIHFLYLLFLLSIIFIFINMYLLQFDNIAALSIAGIVGLITGFFLDRKYEEKELHFIKDVGDDNLDEAAKNLFNIELSVSTIITPNE